LDAILNALLKFSRLVDAVNLRIGKWLSWLILAAVLVSAANATIRKLFDTSSNAWLELQWVLFNEHIRIDIVNNDVPKRVRDCDRRRRPRAFFLLPLTVIMVITGWPVLPGSYRLNEQSFSAGGLPQWPAKSLILIGFIAVVLAGLSELIKRIAVMRGLIPIPTCTARPDRSRGRKPRPDPRPRSAEPTVGQFLIHNMAPIMFAALVVFLLLGYPVAFALAANGLFFG
jgi:TRAP-type mannitol/chloroaromatic compound transport system permease small subunit